MEITNQTLGGSTVDTAGVGFSYDSTTFTATWNLSTLTTPLEAGFYDIELKSDSIEAVDSGLLLDGDEDGQGGDQFSKSYYLAIPGDANLDGQVTLSVPNLFTRVNTGDVAIARSNVGAANVSWQQGDFDGNGEVSLSIPNLFTRVNTGDVAVARANVGRDVRPPTTAASAKLPAVLPEITTATVTAQASVLPVTVVSVVDPVGAPLATVQPVAPIEVARVQSIEPAVIHSTESIVDSEPAQPPVLSQSFAALLDDSDTPEVIVTGETPTIPSTSTLAALSGSLAADHAQSDNSDRDDVFSNLTDEDVRDTDLADIIFPIAAVVE